MNLKPLEYNTSCTRGFSNELHICSGDFRANLKDGNAIVNLFSMSSLYKEFFEISFLSIYFDCR